MGIRRKKRAPKDFTEKSIQKILRYNFLSNLKYVIDNLYIWNWESDCLFITPSFVSYEVEIKISKSDFVNDFNKVAKHRILMSKLTNQKPNYFYYGCPSGLIEINEVPVYAGLIWVDKYGGCSVVKSAPKLHAEKFDVVEHRLTDKFYYNMLEWKEKCNKIQQSTEYKSIAAARKTGIQNLMAKVDETFGRSCYYSYFPYGEQSWPYCRLLGAECNLKCKIIEKFKKNLR